MKKVTSFSRLSKSEFNEIRTAIDTALASVGKKYNLKFHAGNTSYTESVATIKLEASVIGADGTAVTKDVEDFKRFASMFGLSQEMLGQSITIQGKKFTVVGLKPNAPKRPVRIADENGKNFVVDAETVVRQLTPVRQKETVKA
jgi:hypothetical protein